MPLDLRPVCQFAPRQYTAVHGYIALATLHHPWSDLPEDRLSQRTENHPLVVVPNLLHRAGLDSAQYHWPLHEKLRAI